MVEGWGCEVVIYLWTDVLSAVARHRKKYCRFSPHPHTQEKLREETPQHFSDNWCQPEHITQILDLILGQSQDHRRETASIPETRRTVNTSTNISSLKIHWNVEISITSVFLRGATLKTFSGFKVVEIKYNNNSSSYCNFHHVTCTTLSLHRLSHSWHLDNHYWLCTYSTVCV